MARSDLVVNLVETGISGNLPLFVKTVEAIAEDARGRHHYHFAEKLASILSETKSKSSGSSIAVAELQNSFYETYSCKM